MSMTTKIPRRNLSDPTLPKLLGLVESERGSVRWERVADGRWFVAEFSVDLLDGPHLALRWGGLRRKASGRKRIWFDGDSEGMTRELDRICKRRRKHGYVVQ